MARYTTSGTVTTVQQINAELEKIADSQTDFVTRSGKEPNEFLSDLDMNGNKIINTGEPTGPNDLVRLQDLGRGTAEFTTDNLRGTTSELVFSDLSFLEVGSLYSAYGFYVLGDHSPAEWRKSSLTGTPSQLPVELGEAAFTDSTGAKWLYVGDFIDIKHLGALVNGAQDDTPFYSIAYADGRPVKTTGDAVNFTFEQPPYETTVRYEDVLTNRVHLGGAGEAVLFNNANLQYINGPHPTTQVQAFHDRVIAKGSQEIGAQYADYAKGYTIEKENWSESFGVPDSGEINTLTLFLRNGVADGGPKTGGAAILGNIGQTAGSGYVQLVEATNSVFTKGTLEVEKQSNIQLLGIDERDNLSYGAVLTTFVGQHTGAIRVQNQAPSTWGRVLENVKNGVTNFFIDDVGSLRWRINGESIKAVQDPTTSELYFENNNLQKMCQIRQDGFSYKKKTVITAGPSFTLDETNQNGSVSLTGDSPITLNLPSNLPLGYTCKVLQRDNGQITFVADVGVGTGVLRNRLNHTKTAGKYAVVEVSVFAQTPEQNGAVWYLHGDTAA